MSYEFYKVAHILGLLMIFAGLAALWGASSSGAPLTKALRSRLGMIHGIGLLLSLVAGFGMLAKLGILSSGLPGWVHVKIAIWATLGAAAALVRRKATWGLSLLSALIALGALAAYMAIVKPF